MSERKTSDDEIKRILRFWHPGEEANRFSMTKVWSVADIDYAIEHIWDVHRNEEQCAPLRNWYRALRVERDAAEQHAEISAKLEALKKPHWSVTPNFWLTVAILILTAVGVYGALRK